MSRVQLRGNEGGAESEWSRERVTSPCIEERQSVRRILKNPYQFENPKESSHVVAWMPCGAPRSSWGWGVEPNLVTYPMPSRTKAGLGKSNGLTSCLKAELASHVTPWRQTLRQKQPCAPKWNSVAGWVSKPPHVCLNLSTVNTKKI